MAHVDINELDPAHTVVVATGNAHKVTEIEAIIAPVMEGVRFVALGELGDYPDPVENGETFHDNALIKARAALDATGLVMAVADDSGLCVDALDGASAGELEALVAALPAFDLRRRAANDEAMVVACYLRCHPAVSGLRYPGLPDDPDHEAAAALLFDGFGPLVDFRLAGEASWCRVACGGGDARGLVARLEARLCRQGC